jgi:magnesium chelatase family protein
LLDRLDIQIELPPVKPSDLTLPTPKEASVDIAARVGAARSRQITRYRELGFPQIRNNAQVDGELLERLARPDPPGLELLREAADTMNLSARGFHRVLRVARTLADLAGRETVNRLDVAEALSYRQRLAAFEAAAA